MADTPAVSHAAPEGGLRRRGASGAIAAIASGGRLHFQHGPIDLLMELRGDAPAVRAASAAAWQRFDGLLQELVGELPLLRSPLRPVQAGDAAGPVGPVARRMVAACRPHADRFITPMAAVAGAVADEILQAMTDAARLERALVNNGGDIAIHLGDAADVRIGIVADPSGARAGGPASALDGTIVLTAADAVGGVATSGWRGRSLSLGIADSVTVLASCAAAADAAATMIANAVNVDHARIVRARACDVVDDSDLGERLVTRAVPNLPADVVARALDAGVAHALGLLHAGTIAGAALVLQGRHRVVGMPAGRVETCSIGSAASPDRPRSQTPPTKPSGRPCPGTRSHRT